MSEVQPSGGNHGSGSGGTVRVFGASPEIATVAAGQPAVDSSGLNQPNARLSDDGRAPVPPYGNTMASSQADTSPRPDSVNPRPASSSGPYRHRFCSTRAANA